MIFCALFWIYLDKKVKKKNGISLHLRWQPRGSLALSPKKPALHLSQRAPSMLSLQRHCPEIMRREGSSCPSQMPPFREPSGSQSQASRENRYKQSYTV